MTGIQSIPSSKSEYSGVLATLPGALAPGRARGRARIGFVAAAGETRLHENFQSGSAKIRLPRGVSATGMEAILLNTAGGLTGGDRIVYEVEAGAGSHAVLSTQAAERIYRRIAGEARISTTITVGARARLDWLPQETIVFDDSALVRRLDADIAADATLLAVEAIVLGRTAMGETAPNVSITDGWRIRRGGRLVFADGFRLHGNAEAIMAGGATGGGAIAFASLVMLGPDAEAHLDGAREALAGCHGEAGASAWNGMLVARLAAPNGNALRQDLIALIERLRGTAMPRVWNC